MVMFMVYFTDSLLPLKNRLTQLLQSKNRVVAAFDGRSAAGKSSAAEWLAVQLGGEVIHMDDFFLPLELRTLERLAEPGGNVHRERFETEVLQGLVSGEVFRYRRFDCSVMDYGESVSAGDKRLIIIEGAYSLHPSFGNYYDLAVFFDIEPDEQKKRILKRNGPEKLVAFTQRWIPMEERYISAFDIENRCDMVIKGGLV